MANLSTRCRYGRRLLGIAGTALIVISSSLPAAAAPRSFSSTAQYARVLRSFNPHLSRFQSGTLADHVRTEALFYRLDPRLLVALVAIESSWHPYATSPVGAGGLGQLMPGTAAGLGVNAYSPYANLNGTARYLRGLLNRFSAYGQRTRYAYALAGYNAGPGAVIRFGGVPPYAETQNYVRNVLGVWQRLALSLSAHIDNFARPPLSIALAARASRYSFVPCTLRTMRVPSPSSGLAPYATQRPSLERIALLTERQPSSTE